VKEKKLMHFRINRAAVSIWLEVILGAREVKVQVVTSISIKWHRLSNFSRSIAKSGAVRIKNLEDSSIINCHALATNDYATRRRNPQAADES